jgi:hypothetical protein
MEIEIACLELKLSLPGGDLCALRILRDETKVGFTGQIHDHA